MTGATLTATTIAGILFPSSLLQTEWFAVLASFVALNTLLYVTLAVGKLLPKVHPSDWWYRLRNHNRRSESRSIYPVDPADDRRAAPEDGRAAQA